jgi:hypothetical protein
MKSKGSMLVKIALVLSIWGMTSFMMTQTAHATGDCPVNSLSSGGGNGGCGTGGGNDALPVVSGNGPSGSSGSSGGGSNRVVHRFR